MFISNNDRTYILFYVAPLKFFKTLNSALLMIKVMSSAGIIISRKRKVTVAFSYDHSEILIFNIKISETNSSVQNLTKLSAINVFFHNMLIERKNVENTKWRNI